VYCSNINDYRGINNWYASGYTGAYVALRAWIHVKIPNGIKFTCEHCEQVCAFGVCIGGCIPGCPEITYNEYDEDLLNRTLAVGAEFEGIKPTRFTIQTPFGDVPIGRKCN
jgi:hypothetical protein